MLPPIGSRDPAGSLSIKVISLLGGRPTAPAERRVPGALPRHRMSVSVGSDTASTIAGELSRVIRRGWKCPRVSRDFALGGHPTQGAL